MMNNNADNPFGTDVDFVERFTDLFYRQRQRLFRRELVDSGLVTHTGRKKRYYFISEKLMDVLSPYDADIRENVEWQKQISKELESRMEINPSVLRLKGLGSW